MVVLKNWCSATLDELCVPTEQVEPTADRAFIYIDIAAVDRRTKRITAPQHLMGCDAPSRARKLVRSGDTLVSMTRPNLNAVAMVDSELDGQIASTGFEVLRAPAIDPRWIAYLVRTSTFVDAMSELVQGALYPAVRSKDVRAFRVPVAPRAEQQRIADKLDTVLARVDACRDRLARVAPLLKRFRQSVLATAFQDPRFVGVVTDRGSEWSTRPLRDLSERVSVGHVGLTSEHYTDKVGGVALVRSQNVRPGRFSLEGMAYITPMFHAQLRKSRLVAGDLMVVRVGANRGDACVVPTNHAGELNCANIVFALPRQNIVLPAFLGLYFQSPQCQEVLLSASVGGAQGVINTSVVGNVPVPLPPLETQAAIVHRVEVLFAFANRLEARLTQAQAAVDRLTPSLLAKAFRGELVPQDPADEPAAELLKRLAAQREAEPARPRRKRATA
jgi:type I restriction enzyme, S subunit